MPLHYNDALDDPLLFERCETFAGGMDGFTRATLLRPDQAQWLENIVVEDSGAAVTRRGVRAVPPAAGSPSGAPIGAMTYLDFPSTQTGMAPRERLYAAAGPAVFALASETLWMPPAVPGSRPIRWLTHGARWAYALDGARWHRSDASGPANLWTTLGLQAGTLQSDPPAGATFACWHACRMFASGDPAQPDTLWASNLGDAGPGAWNHAEFCLRIGDGEGDDITCLAPVKESWLFVGKAGSLYTVQCDPAQPTAAGWLVQLQARGVGCVGPRAAIPFGNDVLFMARDGVRSLQSAAGLSSRFEVLPPLSLPVQPWIDRVNWEHARVISAHAYKQFAFFAIPVDGATSPNCVLVWDGRARAWAGAWTGWAPVCWATTRFALPGGPVEKLAFGDPSGAVRFWLDFATDTDDAYLDDGQPVVARVRSRGFLFGEPVNSKTPRWAQWRFDTGKDIVIRWTVDGAPAGAPDTAALELTHNQLPLDLPFDLAASRPSTLVRPLSGLASGNEFDCEITSPAGRLALRNLTVAAYADSLKDAL